MHGSSTGIQIYYEGVARGNEVWESGTGLNVQSARAENNVLRQNGTGISASSANKLLFIAVLMRAALLRSWA